jgi:hypothetical protein
MDTAAADVFLSYSRADAEAARRRRIKDDVPSILRECLTTHPTFLRHGGGLGRE